MQATTQFEKDLMDLRRQLRTYRMTYQQEQSTFRAAAMRQSQEVEVCGAPDSPFSFR